LPVAALLVWFAGGKAWSAEIRRRLATARAWKPAFVAPLVLLALVATMAGCGGKSSNPAKPVINGTPAGTYTLVVTATSGSTTHSTQLTLTVQ
jgi:hypothetical protein